MATTNPPADLSLKPLGGDARTLREWLMTFHMASVILDPYTNESAWILKTAARVLAGFRGAAVRVNFVVACDADEAKQFLGPLAEEFLVFTDPDRTFAKGCGLSSLPAFVFIQGDGELKASAEGWDPYSWNKVAETIAETTSWSKPTLPGAGDPAAYHGTPV